MSSASIACPRTRLAPLCLHGFAQQLRIGQQEVGRRQRAGDLLDVEAGLVARVLVDPLGAFDQLLRPARGDQIGLLQEVEDGIFGPFGILEAVVLRLGPRPGRRRRRPARACSVVPRGRGIGEPSRVCASTALWGSASQYSRDLAERLDHLADALGDARIGLAAPRAASGRPQSPCRLPRRSGPILPRSSSKFGTAWAVGVASCAGLPIASLPPDSLAIAREPRFRHI